MVCLYSIRAVSFPVGENLVSSVSHAMGINPPDIMLTGNRYFNHKLSSENGSV